MGTVCKFSCGSALQESWYYLSRWLTHAKLNQSTQEGMLSFVLMLWTSMSSWVCARHRCIILMGYWKEHYKGLDVKFFQEGTLQIPITWMDWKEG